MSAIRKIGVLTGGGDSPGLNAVLHAVTKSAINNYGLQVVGFMDGFKGMVENDYRELDLESIAGIATLGGTILGSSNRDSPFRYPSELNGVRTFTDRSAQALSNLEKLHLDAVIIIGGDGTMHIAQRFAEMGVNIVAVPKTIDNDVALTDYSVGFHTAVDTASEALDRLHTTAQSHHRVMVMEVMGRYAGWIALYAGLAGGAHVILIPEIPFEMGHIVKTLQERRVRGRKYNIIVVAEGTAPAGGEPMVRQMVLESEDPVRLGGIGNYLGAEIERQTGMETRVTVLGHLQRGGSPGPFDRILATRFGVAAVDSIMKQRFGTMVSVQGRKKVNVAIKDAIAQLKRVVPGGELVKTARALDISFGDR
ncbi:MAG: 6-phosphofructokinase [Syntrophomonadaceae bacterium]|nr:6-phosphofructokinase [Syntrophomonadaceae bacterium]